jgi:predicted secreted protein
MDLYPEGEGTGVWKISGDIIVTALELTAATEENVSASVTFQGTGALTRIQTA